MKKARHEAILTLIEKENIGTQEILLDRLIEEARQKAIEEERKRKEEERF